MSAALVQELYAASRVPSTNLAEEEEALVTLCCKWGPKEEAAEPLTPGNPLQSRTGLALQGTTPSSGGRKSEVVIPIFGMATLPSLEPPSLMGDAKTIGPSPHDLTDAGECSHFEKDRRNENHYAGENGIIADASIYWDFATDPFELVCGTEGQHLGIELLDEWGSETKMEDDQSCEGLYSECEEKVDHSYSRIEKCNGNGKGRVATDGEGNGISCDLGLPPTKDGSRADSVALQDGFSPLQNGIPPFGNIFVLPTEGGLVENLQNGLSPLPNGFSRDLILPPTKDGSGVDSVALQNGVSPLQNGIPRDLSLPPTKDGSGEDSVTLQNGVSLLQNVLVPPSGDESSANLQNGGSCEFNLPSTKDGALADSITLQSSTPPLHNGIISSAAGGSSGSAPLHNLVLLMQSGSMESSTTFHGVSPLQNIVLPLTEAGFIEDRIIFQNGTSPLRNITVSPTGDRSMESSMTLQNGVSSLCDPVLPQTGNQDMNNLTSPLPIDGQLAMLDEENETLWAESNCFSCNLSIDLHSPSLSCDPKSGESAPSQEKHPETTNEDLVPLPVEADITSGVSLDGECLGACKIHLPFDEEMPPANQNGGNNEIGGLETRRNNMVDVLRPSVPYVDDLCLILETCTISEDLKVITERDVDESNEITQISVCKLEETQHFIPEERQIDDRTQTSFLKPEEIQMLSDGDSSLKERPDPSESSVEKTELLTSAFSAEEEGIVRPFKALKNATKFGDTMPDDPSATTASSASFSDILTRPPLKCLKTISSSGRMKRRKILETEHPFSGFSRRTESVMDNNRALHQHWDLPKWAKRSVEGSRNSRRPLSKSIPPQIVRLVHGVQRRVDDYPLRTIKHPFNLPKMAAEVPQTSPCNMDSSRRTTGERIASLVDIFKPGKCAEESNLLRKLSVLANTISPPQRPKPTSNIPRLGRKTILDLLSSVVNANVQKSNLQSSFSLFPLESTGFCILALRSKLPFATPSFRFKMASIPTRKLTPAWKETPVRLPFKWTFSFLLSQSITGLIPNSSPVKKDGGCPVGLQTVLALFSPGYSRLWVRKWRLPAQRLAFFQFTGASYDPSLPPSDLFASLLSTTFDSGLSTWRQFNSPSSEVPPLCSPQETSSVVSTFPSPWLCLKLQNRLPESGANTRNSRRSLNMNLQTFNHTAMSMELPVPPKDHTRWEPSFLHSMPTFLLTPEPPWSRLPAPAFSVRNSLEELEVPVPALPPSAEPEKKKPKKVSQIRIRKTIPKPDPNLTPMGLPRPKRLQKTEFSLEEIYTNKNYKSPPATRSLETIFEEPKELRGGAWVWVSHQKRKRVLEFPDFTLPRKHRPRGRLCPAGQGFTRAQKAALGGRELDALLLQRLTDLEAFCARQDNTES